MDDGFRWRACMWHLTYPDHLPPQTLLALLERTTSIKTVCTSVVHEQSNAEVPYGHTHLAWLWERAPNLHGSGIMDVEINGSIIHPHAVHKKSLKWLQHIFTRYHHGHKVSAAGKPIFVAPVAGPWQDTPPSFEWGDQLLNAVSAATDLIEGAKIAGVSAHSELTRRARCRWCVRAQMPHRAPPGAFKACQQWLQRMWGAGRHGEGGRNDTATAYACMYVSR